MIRSLLTVFALAATMTIGSLNAYAAQLGFDFSNVPTAQIQFDGSNNSFTFITNAPTQVDFSITNDNGNFPTSVVSYIGNITGSFNFGATGDPTPVTGSGFFQIATDNSLTNILTGSLEWVQLQSTSNTIGGLNGQAFINIIWTGITGSDANLQALFDEGAARAVLTFQLIGTGDTSGGAPGEDCGGLIGGLRCGGIQTASYSGTVVSAPIPEPSTLFLSGFALLGLGGMLRRRAKKA